MKKMGIKWFFILAFLFLMVTSALAARDFGLTGVYDETLVERIIQITPGDPANPIANVRDWIPCWGVNPWSYDGEWIVYQSQVGDGSGDSKNEICIIRANGTDYQRLTENSLCDTHGNFTPDGTKIVFQRGKDSIAEVWIMNIDGSNQQSLTQAHGGPVIADGCEQKAMVSPDGTKIAFRACTGSGSDDESGQIWVMNIDGTNPVKVTGDLSSNTKHSWSPDSQWILFSSEIEYDVNTASRIFKVRSTGTDLTMLSEDVDDPACENWAAWSPNGQWISYHRNSNVGGDVSEIWIMSFDGTGKHLLVDAIYDALDTEDEWICGPHSWSPDSKQIVFKKNWDYRPHLGYMPLFIVDIRTGNANQLTAGYDDGRMWWGPDGTHILFHEYSSSSSSPSGPTRDGGLYNHDLLVLVLAEEEDEAVEDDDSLDTLNKLKALNDDDNGACFIATAASSSPLAGQVEMLRQFVQRGAEVCRSVLSQWTSCRKLQ